MTIFNSIKRVQIADKFAEFACNFDDFDNDAPLINLHKGDGKIYQVKNFTKDWGKNVCKS